MQNNLKPTPKEVEQAIIDRDRKDAEIDKSNRSELIKHGLKNIQPKKIIKIDTGKVIGVQNVVDLIKKEITPGDKIISIEGESGCGKSATVRVLSENLGATIVSASEVFRYLTFTQLNGQAEDINKILSSLGYHSLNGKTYLFDNKINVTKDLHSQLHTHQVDIAVAVFASKNQVAVLNFLNKEIERLSERPGAKLILEGRAHSLDYLPCDLRVKLVADINIRVKRRLEQER